MGSGRAIIDTDKFSASLRTRGIKLAERRILITNFHGSQQERDFTVPANCMGFGRIHHFRRLQPPPWPENPLPIDPAAKALGLGALDTIDAQVFQNAFCSWRCWYCFVDFDLLSANPTFAEFKTSDELVDLYLSESERAPVIDLSGGQPDLVPEWGVWFVEALARRRILNDVYVWSDDNLSNDYFWRYLSDRQRARLVGCSNYGRVGCFKGFDAESFSFNTSASADMFAQQFSLMRRLVEAGFDVYGYVTLTSPRGVNLGQKMADFVDRLQDVVHPNFPLRTVPLRVLPFTPTKERLVGDRMSAFDVQEEAVLAWSEELRKRFTADTLKRPITEHCISRG